MIVFTGDINLTDWYFNLGFGIGSKITQGINPFEFVNRQEQDIWIGNFEGVSSINTKNKTKYEQNVFRILPEALAQLNHFNFYGLANNHVMQHGATAYIDTIDNLKSLGVSVFGTKECKTLTFTYNHQISISLTGVSFRVDEFSENPLYYHYPDLCDLQTEIASLPANTFKILYVHWGNEYINYPSVYQRHLAHSIIDMGYDLIIGMHPHILQGYEVYKNKRIYYSLGNFVFDMAGEDCRYGAYVELDFVNNTPIFSEKYVYIDKIGFPHDTDSPPLNYKFENLNKHIETIENTEQYHSKIKHGYKKYKICNYYNIFKNLFLHPFNGIDIIYAAIKRIINNFFH